MNISNTIDLATAALGVTQTQLAEMLGIPRTHLSNFKKGRPISYQKHAQIAAIAGLQDRAARIIYEGMAAELSEDLPHEKQVKKALLQLLRDLPEEQPTIANAPQSKGASARGVAAEKPRLRKSLRT